MLGEHRERLGYTGRADRFEVLLDLIFWLKFVSNVEWESVEPPRISAQNWFG
jgi:hypothetical protein